MKKKYEATTVEKIRKMQEKGLNSEEIIEFLDLEETPDVIIAQFEEDMQIKNVADTAKILQEELPEQLWNPNKVWRYIVNEKKITPVEKKGNRGGYRIHISEINRFIAEQKMSASDWKERAMKAENEASSVAEMKQKIDELQAELDKAQKEITKLKKENTSLKKSKTANKNTVKKDEVKE